MTPLLLITCKLESCGRGFLVCSSCYRGHRYCSNECALAGRLESVKRARRKYARSEEAKARHRMRARAYYRQRIHKKILPDQTSKSPASRDRLLPEAPSPRRCTSRKRHAHGFANVDIEVSEQVHTVEDPSARCEWCGRIGMRILFRTRRFQR